VEKAKDRSFSFKNLTLMGNLPAAERNPFSCGSVLGWVHCNTLSNIGDFCLRIVLASIALEDVQIFQRGFSHRIWSSNLKTEPQLFDSRLIYHLQIRHIISYKKDSGYSP